MKTQDTLEATVTDLLASGEGLVTVKGKRMLVPLTVPGDHVVFQPVGREGGALLEVLDEGPDRVKAPCPHFGVCGGCQWQHVSAEKQREVLLGWLRRSVPAVAFDTLEPEVLVGEPYGYRTRCRLAWSVQDGAVHLGYRLRAAHALAPLTSCVVLAQPLQDALVPLREALAVLGGTGELGLALGAGGRPVTVLRPEKALGPEGFRVPESLVAKGFAGAELWVPGASSATVAGDPRPVLPGADGEDLVLAPGGFAQANERLNRALALRVAEAARCKGKRVLELFAGAGNFTVLLAREARVVVAVESDVRSAGALRDNVTRRGLTNVRVRAEDVGDTLTELEKAEVLVLDPPRTGAREVCEQVGALAAPPRRVVYVSCDPPTLGRDLGYLTQGGGLRVSSLRAVEMFPQTTHLETVAVLEAVPRRKARW